jgi:hypothetical protein
MKSTMKPSTPHSSRRVLCCILASLFAGSCFANEVFVVGNIAISANSAISFLESLHGQSMSEINEETVLNVEGRVFLGPEAGDQLACAELRIKTGGQDRRAAALYVRRILLTVSGDVEINGDMKGPWAGLILEPGARFSWGGTMSVVGSFARLGVVGDGTAEGGSLVLEGGELCFYVKNRSEIGRIFSETRPAQISVESDFSASADAAVRVVFENDAVDTELPEGKFALVSTTKTSGEVPELEITGISPEQAARASLKLDEDGLSLIVAPAP